MAHFGVKQQSLVHVHDLVVGGGEFLTNTYIMRCDLVYIGYLVYLWTFYCPNVTNSNDKWVVCDNDDDIKADFAYPGEFYNIYYIAKNKYGI